MVSLAIIVGGFLALYLFAKLSAQPEERQLARLEAAYERFTHSSFQVPHLEIETGRLISPSEGELTIQWSNGELTNVPVTRVRVVREPPWTSTEDTGRTDDASQ